SVPERVFAVLEEITRRHLPPTRVFCEWGSGFSTATCLAALLGYEAYGLEIDEELVRLSRAIARRLGIPATMLCTSFLPAGYAAYAGSDGAALVTPASVSAHHDTAEARGVPALRRHGERHRRHWPVFCLPVAGGARADAAAVCGGGAGGGAAGSVLHGHGHSRLAGSVGRGGAGGLSYACTPTLAKVEGSVLGLMARVPHRQSLSPGSEGKSPVWRARTCPDSASPVGQKGSQQGQTRAGLDSLVQYIPFCRVKGRSCDPHVSSWHQRLACCTCLLRSCRPAIASPMDDCRDMDSRERMAQGEHGTCTLELFVQSLTTCAAHPVLTSRASRCSVPTARVAAGVCTDRAALQAACASALAPSARRDACGRGMDAGARRHTARQQATGLEQRD